MELLIKQKNAKERYALAFFIFLNLLANLTLCQEIIIRGQVINKTNNEPVPFVNIGVHYKNVGTVSNAEGKFSLIIPDTLINDTVTFSSIGFESQNFPIKRLNKKEYNEIYLFEKIYELISVSIDTDKNKVREKTLGVKNIDGVRGAITVHKNKLGAQIGYLFEPRYFPVFLKTVQFHISENPNDTLLFRLRIYRYDKEKNIPSEDILIQNVIIHSTISKGWIEVDLSKYKVIVDENFFIAIEWLKELQGLQLTGVMTVGGCKTWNMITSEGNWYNSGIPANFAINVSVLYEKK